MRKVLQLLGIVTAAISSCVTATTLPRIPIEQLFHDADVVVIAKITKGELIGIGEETCGAKYHAKVEESFKGSSKGATIEFGNYYGYELGERYVLFLVGAGRRYEPLVSTNSSDLEAKAKALARCGRRLDRNTVMHSGNGALAIHWTGKFKYKDGVRVPTRYVALPEGTETTPAIASEQEEFSEIVWVKLENMVQLLNGLAR